MRLFSLFTRAMRRRAGTRDRTSWKMSTRSLVSPDWVMPTRRSPGSRVLRYMERKVPGLAGKTATPARLLKK